ncbi:G1/S-specific cyclin-D3-like [Macrosteles quadrilineatus]|uniref:G1/S-specific cyclin-D3-like n=1 Tax=Macrosteles quadrilineatus TaxID=74068 RepID=UPI0023E2B115|nr:G1/S-specific cyclin-D3-like [Macrosteles quadrilineatus]
MADLLCAERIGSVSESVADLDPTIFSDRRVLDNLLTEESRYIPRCNYFATVQTGLLPFMRKVVATWMMEVCEEERCESQVFSIAVNLLDRFLCEVRVDKTQLQMVACVCLLVASKVRQCHALSVHKLEHYTDYSVSSDQIRQFEVVLLAHLRWDLSAVTGYDLVDHVMERITWSRDQYPLVRRHAKTLVDLCYLEPYLFRTPPSLIASGCLLAAARGLKVPEASVASICALTRCCPEDVTRTASHIETLMHEVAFATPRSPPSPALAAPKSAHPHDHDTDVTTPTDVDYIFF